MGVTFDDWQEGAGRVILAKRSDDHLAAMIDGVGLSLPRQVGKTYLVASMVFALCVNMPGLLVIWSAHHSRTHEETFLALQGFADRQKVAPHVEQVFTGSGTEEIRFHNKSRILFGARERGFGRGIPGVDVLIFDEAQILSDKALANMLATMNTSQFGLQLYIGTPPKPDDMSEAFTRMRNEAKAGTLTDGAWIELGADADADLNDRAQWRKANPSFPTRTPVQSLLRLKRKLTDADWRREGMGIWDEFDATSKVVPRAAWDDCLDPDAGALGQPFFAFDVAPDRSWAAIGVSAPAVAGKTLIEVTSRDGAMDHRPGTDWLVPRFKQLRERWPNMKVHYASSSGAGSLVPALEALGIECVKVSTGDTAAACGVFYDHVIEQKLVHLGQDSLTNALVSAKKRTEDGESAWVWGRKRSGADITPLYAVTLALWVAYQAQGADYDVADSIH